VEVLNLENMLMLMGNHLNSCVLEGLTYAILVSDISWK
jgi:hypothetical protein